MAARLLIIEWDEQFRRNLSEHLCQEGLHVWETNGDVDLEAILEEQNPDVVILGLEGYGRKGLTFLERIKEKRSETEVILMVPKGQLTLSIEGMKRGAFDDIWLPIDLAVLLERIGAAFRKKQERARRKKSLRERFEEFMVAASFAEAGAPEIARQIINKQDKKPSSPRRRKEKSEEAMNGKD